MSSKFPPRSYDDSSIVPERRLKMLLGQFEDELTKVRKVFLQHLPGQFQANTQFEKDFWKLRHSAEELGTEYTFLVEKIIEDYEEFQKEPDQAKLDRLFRDIKSLQLLLVG